MEHVGFFLFNILLFVLLFVLLWRAKNVSAPFKLFLALLLVVIFISPVYMRVRDLQANIVAPAAEESPSISEVAQEIVVPSYLPFVLDEVRGLFPDAQWSTTFDETTGISEELFRMSSGVFGILYVSDARLTSLEISVDVDAPKVVTALLDMQLALSRMSPELVESGWMSTRVAQIRNNTQQAYTDAISHMDVLYTLHYDPAQGKIIVRVTSME